MISGAGPIVDYIMSEDSKVGEMNMFIARGIGAESALYQSRNGLTVVRTLSKGQLPFKVNHVWSITRTGGEKPDLLVFDLLDLSVTIVYEVNLQKKTFE